MWECDATPFYWFRRSWINLFRRIFSFLQTFRIQELEQVEENRVLSKRQKTHFLEVPLLPSPRKEYTVSCPRWVLLHQQRSRGSIIKSFDQRLMYSTRLTVFLLLSEITRPSINLQRLEISLQIVELVFWPSLPTALVSIRRLSIS